MLPLDRIHAQIDSAMPGDRHRLRSRLCAPAIGEESRKTRRAGRGDVGPGRGTVGGPVAPRRQNVPEIRYEAELPVSARREQIAEAIRNHQVVIVCGETGSGKSTQIPKICLGLGRGVERLIGHTQPRRIAARSITARIAEVRSPLGKAVGYKIRFTDATGDQTYIKLMTDGILLAETQRTAFSTGTTRSSSTKPMSDRSISTSSLGT